MSFLESVGSLFGWFQGPVRNNGPHSPSYEDICEVRAVLKANGLPTELVWQILDYAEYIPQHIFTTSPDQAKLAAARMGRPSHACLCMDAGIFNNTTVNPIRKGGEQPRVKDILFEISSRDQGWTSENTQGSYETSSWLEVSILRSMDENNTRLPGPPFVNVWISNPSDFQQGVSERGWYLVKRPPEAEQGPQGGEGDFAWYLQGNQVARPQPEGGYRVKWTANGYEGNQGAGAGSGFIRELKDGDRILIWARAKWPGWECAVDSIKVTVRYDTNR